MPCVRFLTIGHPPDRTWNAVCFSAVGFVLLLVFVLAGIPSAGRLSMRYTAWCLWGADWSFTGGCLLKMAFWTTSSSSTPCAFAQDPRASKCVVFLYACLCIRVCVCVCVCVCERALVTPLTDVGTYLCAANTRSNWC